ncbi:MAG: hypothetical protein A3A22_00395 [Candidatus Taylorbacteria bacterium RIFCSPLOWO2_01_FULL_45_34b]|nr:MAG: hypothetical protein A3A22_00395 [Candidatus Taylorbacteria bacterium RIFCSPLOWO2_01_FULL_45_34b]
MVFSVPPMSTKSFFRFFPTPKFLQLPAVGFDISDQAVRFLELESHKDSFRVGRFGEKVIPNEALLGDDLTKNKTFGELLFSIRREQNLGFINASLPEEKAYLFKTEIPRVRRDEIRSSLEFRLEEFVPVPSAEAVFDYDIIKKETHDDKHLDVSVSVVPVKVVSSYIELFQNAGLTPLSFEIEGQAIARAVVKKGDKRTIMVVNFSDTRTGLFIVSEGVVNFSSTIGLGGRSLTIAIKKSYNVSFADAEKIKKEKGFKAKKEDKDLFFAAVNTLSVLRDEINRLLSYWRTHKDNPKENEEKVDLIVFSGFDSSLEGFLEYFSLNLPVPVELANVWVNVCAFGDYIPPISFAESLKYGAAVGLAMTRPS